MRELWRRVGATLVSILLVACVRSSPDDAQRKPAPRSVPPAVAPIGTATFAWVAPLAIRVHESVEQAGARTQVTYVLDVCPSFDGALTIAHRDFEIVGIDGLAADDPRLKRTTRDLKPIAAAMPIFVIGADGRLRDLLGMDSMLARMRSLYDAATVDSMERALRNEAARKLLKQGVAQRWSAWVEGWLGVDFSRGSEVTVAAPALNVDPSGELKIPTVMSYVGPVRPGEFKLSARTKLQDDKLRALMSGVNAAFEAGVELTGVHGKAETLAEVETTWPELKPSWSHTRRFLELEVGGKLRREIEDHVYRFDWSSPGRGEPKCAPPSTLN